MNKYQYKEQNQAEEMLIQGFTSKFIASELKVLAKYYKSTGEENIKEKLQEFCKTYLAGYNEAIHFKIINNAVKFALNDKNKLVQINEIEITKSELDAISSLDLIHDHQRVVFTLLVLTKLSKKFLEIKDGEIKSDEFYFGGHKNYRELVSTSKITFDKKKKSTVKNIHDLIHIFDEKGIVEITGNGNIKLLFMYNIENDDNVVLSVGDYHSIGYFYDYYFGENKVKVCESCGKLIKANNNKVKYCEICAKEQKNEQNKRYYHLGK